MFILAVVANIQPLVQWVCELTMTLLSSLPMYSYSPSSGNWLVKDLRSLTVLRQLMVLIRLWYNTVPKIRPVLSCPVNFDAQARLFRLMTMLIVAVKDAAPLPDSLIDGCTQLMNQVIVDSRHIHVDIYCHEWITLIC